MIKFLKARLNERSTWVAIGAGITGAASLPPPLSYAFILVAVIGALLVDGEVIKNRTAK